ncbi:hypothetical protein EVAR_43308_1 [Eumeta japonica]|uniref:Uncharacterized protein n=1 Tax=Eumeta variegata TaxID=151549 RepID=A0A4C1X1X8_EUMVA|nr:hypothetical protein EVAR_43308_1 [Eumeta japonica]
MDEISIQIINFVQNPKSPIRACLMFFPLQAHTERDVADAQTGRPEGTGSENIVAIRKHCKLHRPGAASEVLPSVACAALLKHAGSCACAEDKRPAWSSEIGRLIHSRHAQFGHCGRVPRMQQRPTPLRVYICSDLDVYGGRSAADPGAAAAADVRRERGLPRSARRVLQRSSTAQTVGSVNIARVDREPAPVPGPVLKSDTAHGFNFHEASTNASIKMKYGLHYFGIVELDTSETIRGPRQPSDPTARSVAAASVRGTGPSPAARLGSRNVAIVLLSSLPPIGTKIIF